MSVLVVGDSIAFGEHLPDRLTGAWPALLGTRLGVDVVNLSVCGDTTRLALERAGEWQPLMRETVVFQLGVNDANTWESDRGLPRVSRRAFAANLVELVERAWLFGAVRVLLCTVALHERPMPDGAACERYSETVRAVRAEWPEHVVILDVERLGALPTLDGLHLDAVGHARVAEAAAECLEALAWRAA